MYNPDRGSSDFYNRNSNQQSYSRADRSKDEEGKNRERDRPLKRNRWDAPPAASNGESHSSNGGSSHRRQRDRSRSPIRNNSDSKSVQRTGPPRSNNASSNWSDSSSDEEQRSYHRGSGNGHGRRDEDRSSSHSRWDTRGNSGRQPEESSCGQDDRRDLPTGPTTTSNYNYPVVGNIIDPLELEVGKGLNNNQGHGKEYGNPVTPQSPMMGIRLKNLSELLEPESPSPAKSSLGIQMKLLTQLKPALASKPTVAKPKANIASVFNVDDDDEPEEMPPECKMRMKNVGRETPTSAGPNSFGKTKIGFCNVIQIKERKIQEQLQKK